MNRKRFEVLELHLDPTLARLINLVSGGAVAIAERRAAQQAQAAPPFAVAQLIRLLPVD